MSSFIRPEFEPVGDKEPPAVWRLGILPWLRLMRLPNDVFTAIADVTMGYLFVHRSVEDARVLLCLIGASASLYTAGMVLNDVFDLEVDAKERPFRPLPSGKISLRSAIVLGWLLLGVGVLLGWVAGFLPASTAPWPHRSGVVAILLASCVVVYDGILKQDPLGPVAMGMCRLLNVLLGMSTGPAAAQSIVLGYGAGELLAAAGIGTYIVGVTWFARSEAGVSRSAVLIGAMVLMTLGAALLGAGAIYAQRTIDRQMFWLLLALLMATVLRRCGVAAVDPTPEKVQAGVKHSILSLIWLDAAVAVAVAGPVHGVTIAALLIPALVLGRWVYST